MPRVNRWVVAGVATLAFVAGMGFAAYGGLGRSTGPATTPVVLTIFQDPSTGLYSYSMQSLRAAPGTIAEFTIRNFDPTPHGVDPSFASVRGTIGGAMQVQPGSPSGGNGMGSRSVTSMPWFGVSHTFTILAGGYDLNVPIPPALSPTAPSTVTFSLKVMGPGMVQWTCECPDGGSDGDLPGGMSGSFTSG